SRGSGPRVRHFRDPDLVAEHIVAASVQPGPRSQHASRICRLRLARLAVAAARGCVGTRTLAGSSRTRRVDSGIGDHGDRTGEATRRMTRRSLALRRGAIASALAGIMVAALAACTPSGGVPADSDQSQKIVAMDRFTQQTLTWEGCDDYAITDQDKQFFPMVPEAECARLLVPLDYADPTGDTASVAVIRIAARGDSIGPLLFNPGGPGGAGLLGTIGASALMAESEITERFDLVGFDPRGVGATEPTIDCGLTDGSADAEALLQKVSGVFTPLTENDTQQLVERCAAGSGGLDALAQMGTRTTVKDMDVLREVLGEKQMS